jgi:hypothetical protein
MSQPTIAGSDTSVVSWGKHSGQTFAEVAKSDPEYCQYILATMRRRLEFALWYKARVDPSATPLTAEVTEEINSAAPVQDEVPVAKGYYANLVDWWYATK